MSNNVKNILIVGAGNIAREYCRILIDMGFQPDIVCRSEQKAEAFRKEECVRVFSGGVEIFLNDNQENYDYAIVAVDIESLSDVCCQIIQFGIKKVLVEKPAGMNRREIEKIVTFAEKSNANVYVAYNRRFYAATEKAIQIIKEDGGVKSFNFEFTEWSHVIEPLPYSKRIKENWFLENSTHVVDLAFFLGGEPKEIKCYTSGSLDWHNNAAVYAGAGITNKEALFTYSANWAAPGRWAVEVLTSRHRLFFRPMEKLSIQEMGTVKIDSVDIENELDTKFKPGFYKQTESFIYDIDDGKKKTIQEQLRALDYYEKIDNCKA